MIAIKRDSQLAMAIASTVIFAREDLSIPGRAADPVPVSDEAGSIQARFFELVSLSRPDVIVLDFSRTPADATEIIRTVRRRTDVPILVVCNPEQPKANRFGIAGAAGCIRPPVDIIRLHEAIQDIMELNSGAALPAGRVPRDLHFAGMSFHPQRNRLVGVDGLTVGLTSSEGRLLSHFLAKPRTLCSRGEITELLYGPESNVRERAINVVLSRLRKKLLAAGGAGTEHLIKTEFRRGYSLLADVTTSLHEASAPPRTVAAQLNGASKHHV